MLDPMNFKKTAIEETRIFREYTVKEAM